MPDATALIHQPAPAVTLPSATGEPYTLDPATATKPIVLFFFPQAETYGCTKEACSFRDALASKPLYSGAAGTGTGVQIVGVSPDPVAKQKAFVERHKLTYPVLCDINGEATKAYNVSRGLLGLTAGRTTFIIENGIVQGVHEGVLNFSAHEKFVNKWLQERVRAVNPTPEGQEQPESTTEEPSTDPPEDSTTFGNIEIPPVVAAVEAESAK